MSVLGWPDSEQGLAAAARRAAMVGGSRVVGKVPPLDPEPPDEEPEPDEPLEPAPPPEEPVPV